MEYAKLLKIFINIKYPTDISIARSNLNCDLVLLETRILDENPCGEKHPLIEDKITICEYLHDISAQLNNEHRCLLLMDLSLHRTVRPIYRVRITRVSNVSKMR